MIQRSEILTELYGTGKSVVGFRQPTLSGYNTLSGALLESSSGIYLTDGIVTIPNIKDSQDDKDISESAFNTLLANYVKDSIINALDLVFTNNDKLEFGLLYNNEVSKNEVLDNNGDFVGYEINVINKPEISTFLNSIVAEFNSTSGNVTIYLFHSSQNASIQNESITLGSGNTEKVVDWVLDKHKDFGGTYYIGYYTIGLTPKAINRSSDNSYYRKQFKNVKFRPIKVVGYQTVDELFDIDDIVYVEDTFGLNFSISVNKDYTDYIISNKDRFAKLIKYQFSADMLRMIITSDRTHAKKINILAQRELDGILTEDGKVYSQGILRKLENEANVIQQEFLKKQMYPTIERSI